MDRAASQLVSEKAINMPLISKYFQENLSQYKTIVGTIKNVGDETLLIETNDHQKYLISIAGAIDSNKGLIKGNRIYIYYEGTLDIKNKDIKIEEMRC